MATGTAPDELTKFIQPPGDEAGQLAILLASGNLRVGPKHLLAVARPDKIIATTPSYVELSIVYVQWTLLRALYLEMDLGNELISWMVKPGTLSQLCQDLVCAGGLQVKFYETDSALAVAVTEASKICPTPRARSAAVACCR